MKGHPKTIELLNQLLAEELAAADQYFIHAEMYKDSGFSKLFERIDHERIDELSHARMLIARILFLEGKPDIVTRGQVSVGDNVRTMLENDLQVEYRVGNLLKQVMAHCESVQDYVTRDELLTLLEDTEHDHTHWLEQQLKLIDMVGLQNYLQSQM